MLKDLTIKITDQLKPQPFTGKLGEIEQELTAFYASTNNFPGDAARKAHQSTERLQQLAPNAVKKAGTVLYLQNNNVLLLTDEALYLCYLGAKAEVKKATTPPSPG